MNKKEHKDILHEKEHILKVLQNVKKALIKKNYIKIKNLSNHVIHHASIHQEVDIISIAVIIYSLSKIIEREDYRKEKNWEKFYKNYNDCIENAIIALKKEDLEAFRKEIIHLRKSIQNLSGNLKIYIGDVFRKAKINKASRLYEHGISMEKTAKILGISLWELSEYAGKTRIADVNLAVTLPLSKRIKYAEEIFAKWNILF